MTSTTLAFSPGLGARATAAAVGRRTSVTGHAGHAVEYAGSPSSSCRIAVDSGTFVMPTGTEVSDWLNRPCSMNAAMARLTKPSERQKPRSYGADVPGMFGPSTGGPTAVGTSVCVIGGASGTGDSAVTFESTMKVTPAASSGMFAYTASMLTSSAAPIGPLMLMPASAVLRAPGSAL